MALLVLILLAYGYGLRRLWRRAGIGRGITRTEAGGFAGGALALALALLSPLEAMTGTLLSAHMLQHVLLIAIAPPLLLIGRPDAVFASAMAARRWKASVGSAWLRRPAAAFRGLARPLPAALLHAVAVWSWHAPGPFQAALADTVLHDLEHAAFFLTALLFWQAVITATRSPSLLLPAIAATLATLIQGGFLGALMTLAGQALYPAYGDGARLWGLTSLEDQQLAGLIMWVPAGAIYLAAGLVLAARLIGEEATPVTASRKE